VAVKKEESSTRSDAKAPVTVTAEIELGSSSSLLALAGPGDGNLRAIGKHLGIDVGTRGNVLRLSGRPEKVSLAQRFVVQLEDLASEGIRLEGQDHVRALHALDEDKTLHLRDIFSEVVLMSARQRPIKARGLAQKRYLHCMRTHDLTFGIGPAGTGKTYLAMAVAVQALVAKQVRRIILARPAVEAGERLGFLPGDLEEKVNPYLRPLYDALDDMMDADKVDGLLKRGQIEIAPLAFMRGRAQPYFSRVLTPGGFQPLGSLRVGDRVMGSDGRPTKVLGVHPQGKKEVFRVTAQDGASTLCCGEHLWSVYTPEDRRRDKGPRVLETREMLCKLRRAHQHRFELPLLSGPVKFAPRDVPMDPYALGLLLGDGCMTGSTTPSFATADEELGRALEARLEGIELRAKSRVDYVLRHVAGGRGGLCIPNPVTVTLRELGLCGTRSHTKFIPDAYLYNSPGARLALLQGLLDTDGGPVTQRGRTCRIQYSTTSRRLRDDVVFLVRSLGGVAYWRTRSAEGRTPGCARGRPVGYRHDAYVMDIRLPADIVPFQLGRKIDKYLASGGGRPMRYIDSIRPEGEQDCLCIRVAAPDALYVTDDFLVTHNTLNDCFVILDEAQNSTSEQMRMFLTRLGYNSRAVVTGDITQVDLPAGATSGLAEAAQLLRGIEGLSFCWFTEVDVVRHPLVQRIVVAYERRDAELEKRRTAEARARRDAEERWMAAGMPPLSWREPAAWHAAAVWRAARAAEMGEASAAPTPDGPSEAGPGEAGFGEGATDEERR
jgi:phosphate starvation-inducible PhoH-like protein